MPRSPKKFQKRTLKNSLDHRSWDTKHSVILANYLCKNDQPDQPLTGKPVKAACPALKDFKAPTLNRKIKQVRGRLLENPDWDPRNDVEPMEELNPSDDPVNSDNDSDTDGDNEGTGAPRPSTIPSSDPAATAVLLYFSNNPGTEVFKYVVTLPEAVDSNYEQEYFISHAVKGVDASSGKQVWVKQNVWLVRTYIISGQKVGGMR
ncbi:hypothetical protein HDU99_001072, partial [Rhizoclosmatium hyalinum]